MKKLFKSYVAGGWQQASPLWLHFDFFVKSRSLPLRHFLKISVSSIYQEVAYCGNPKAPLKLKNSIKCKIQFVNINRSLKIRSGSWFSKRAFVGFLIFLENQKCIDKGDACCQPLAPRSMNKFLKNYIFLKTKCFKIFQYFWGSRNFQRSGRWRKMLIWF